VGKPEGKRPLGRPRSMWVVTIDGVELVIGFIGNFNIQLVNTLYRSLSHTD
jgi:hypothetical protein